MLARINRLTGQKNFSRLKKEGRRKSFDLFNVSYVDRKDNDPSRFGFIVTNKTARLATDRSRVKRALREPIRTSMSEIKKGMDILYIAKSLSLKKSTSEIMIEVAKSIEVLGITKR